MTSIDYPKGANDDLLDRHIEAARRQFGAADIGPAAARFRKTLLRAEGRRGRWSLRPAILSVASVALAAILAVSFLVPGTNGTAFAQAQEWLASFRTLQAETTVVAGDVVSTVVTWFDASGDTRIETLATTTIIKPSEGMIYMSTRDGLRTAQAIASETIVGNPTEFLDNIRAFRGQADLLAGTREIDGISAIGYALEVDASSNVLWVDPMDGKPLQVETRLADGTTMHTVLRFDVPLPDKAFDVPE